MRLSSCWFACFIALGSGCGDSSGSPDGTVIMLDGGAFTPGCEPRAPGADPLLILSRETSVETFMPNASAERLALDYAVFPLAHVDYVVVEPDFDASFDLTPERFDGSCPSTVALESLLARSSNDEVFSARIEAGSEDDLRSARVFVPRGSRRIELFTPALRGGTEDYHVVFEPAAGNARAMLVPADVEDDSVTIDGVPDMPGTIVLLRSTDIEWNADPVVGYAPEGFGAGFRTRVDRLYGRILDAGEEERTLTLATWLDVDETIPTLRTEVEVVLNAETPVVRLASARAEATVTLQVPCSASRLTLQSTGFEEIGLGDASERVGPGGRIDVPITCDDETEEATVVVTITSLNGRDPIVVATLDREVTT